MSGQVSQPQPLYQSHSLFMQGLISKAPGQELASSTFTWEHPCLFLYALTLRLIKQRNETNNNKDSFLNDLKK